uniref:hypothetical protein n=1 Tax=Amycolatopsis sp. CA-096443 TaxID=3239919 RepID=UPI003F496A0F
MRGSYGEVGGTEPAIGDDPTTPTPAAWEECRRNAATESPSSGRFLTQCGALVTWAKAFLNLTIKVISRPPDQQGFVVLPRRWVVERTCPD